MSSGFLKVDEDESVKTNTMRPKKVCFRKFIFLLNKRTYFRFAIQWKYQKNILQILWKHPIVPNITDYFSKTSESNDKTMCTFILFLKKSVVII